MRQAIMTEPGRIEFCDAAEPRPGSGEVLLRVRCIGICGSDVHVYHGRQRFTKYPVVQGHEFAAEVAAVGEGVAGPAVGSKATATPQIVCGRCPQCRRGDYHICEALKVQGFQAPGCAQEFFLTRADRVVPLPEELSYEQGAMVEPAAVAVRSVGRAGPIGGRNVVVLGAGPIGNLVAQVARSKGANVLISDPSDERLDVARRCGLANGFNPLNETLPAAVGRVFGAPGFDTAVDCAGAESAMLATVRAIAKGGTIILVAAYGDLPRVDLAMVQEHEVRLMGTLMYRIEHYRQAVELIAAGKIATAPLESRHFPFAEYANAYRYIDEHAAECVKVLIDL